MTHRRSGPGTVESLQRLCRTAAHELLGSGAAVSVMTELGLPAMAVGSDARTEMIEELQATLGEGPCMAAFHSRLPVLVPDIEAEAALRWPGYSPAVRALGVRAVFAFPLQVGTARLGAFDVFRVESGPLTPAALESALSFAEEATRTLLDGQEKSGDAATPGGVAEASDAHLVVHQAQGMVMIQLGVGLTEALARMRAYAYVSDRSLGAVAREIVARTITLERDT